jgi:hypothetical protein
MLARMLLVKRRINRATRSCRLRVPSFLLLVIATATLFYLWRGKGGTPHEDSDDSDILVHLQGLPEPEVDDGPPRFYSWHYREERLPQNDPDLPFPQGREGRYIYFANQPCCASFFYY